MVPPRVELLAPDAPPFGPFAFEQIESKAAGTRRVHREAGALAKVLARRRAAESSHRGTSPICHLNPGNQTSWPRGVELALLVAASSNYPGGEPASRFLRGPPHSPQQ